MLKQGDISILSKNSRYWYRGYKYRLIGDISNNRPSILPKKSDKQAIKIEKNAYMCYNFQYSCTLLIFDGVIIMADGLYKVISI